MLRKLFLLALAVLTIAGSATAGQFALAPTPAGFTGPGTFGGTVRDFSPAVRQVQYYRCRRNCKWCRSDCYNAYRINCYEYGCRQQFVLCMRACWEEICRYC